MVVKLERNLAQSFLLIRTSLSNMIFVLNRECRIFICKLLVVFFELTWMSVIKKMDKSCLFRDIYFMQFDTIAYIKMHEIHFRLPIVDLHKVHRNIS